MNERLKQLRKALSLNQTEFASKLGITQKAISAYETGTAPIPDRTIIIICTIYGVDETWLRTGEGTMFRQVTPDEELAGEFGDILNPDADPQKKEAVRWALKLLDGLDPKYYPVITHFVEQIIALRDEDKH